MTWGLPFEDKYVTGEFNEMSDYRRKHGLGPHRGVDWAPGDKKTIHAVTKGTVKLIQWSDILGWVMVQTGWANGKTYYIGYSHLSCAHHGSYCKGPAHTAHHSQGKTCMKNLKVGDKVELGQVVGRVGSTGSASSGPHLHATLGNKVKSVFYGTVYDLKAFIKEQLEKQEMSKGTLSLSIRIAQLEAEKEKSKPESTPEPEPEEPEPSSEPTSETPEPEPTKPQNQLEEELPKPPKVEEPEIPKPTEEIPSKPSSSKSNPLLEIIKFILKLIFGRK